MIVHPSCKICNHPEVDDVNAKLVAGVSGRVIGEMYNLHYKAVLNHKKKHLPKVLVQAQSLKDSDAADNLLNRVESLFSRSEDLITKAEVEGKYAPAVTAVKECRNCLELIAKLLGELKTGTEINLIFNPQFVQARLTITEALRPYPEARAAVIKALTEGGVVDAEYDESDSTQPGPGEVR